jgi:hypothetical protein
MKNPYPPCIKEDLIYHCFNFIDINPKKKKYISKIPITFGSFPYYEKFATVKRNTVPNTFNVYKLSKSCTVKVVGFKKELMGNEIREIYYFINDIFFMGEYAFSDITKIDIEKIFESLATKYFIYETIVNEGFYIQDKDDSLIYFENNGFSISLQYINLRKPFINEVWDTYFRNAIKRDSLYTRESDLKVYSTL